MSKRKIASSYSLVFITAEEKKEVLANLSTLIEDQKGAIAKKDEWGKKTFSYPIKKNSHGYYYDWTISLPKENIMELKRKLDFEPTILRYLVLTQE